MRVHVGMVVRNEAGRHLERALKSAGAVSDHGDGFLVVTDDCSDDSTAEICEWWGASLQRNSEPLFWRHEGQARQRHLDFVSEHCEPGDWVLSLDADETVSDPQALVAQALRAAEVGAQAVLLPLYEFWDDRHYRVDGWWFGTRTPRLFAWQPGGRIRDRDMACGSEPTYIADAVAQGRVVDQDAVHLLHWGYSRPEDRVAKHARYSARLGGHGHSETHVASILAEPELRPYPG